ncbi:MAG: hypothetical protein D6701_10085 [Gemmatimonadetes bacterium]|nr:MAG: hypothetical protein D6701_10085 [Gemmatimonadota bacterium]
MILLFLALTLPARVSAQDARTGGDRQESGFSLGQNYPNPFNPETRIPFELGPQLFVDGRPAVVSIRIYNALLQYVAAPTALGHPAGDGTRVIELEYTQPGRYEAYWDGRDARGRTVASGVYLLRMTVNGRSVLKKIIVSK